jgi:excisionase family DNA binding protein
MDELPLKPNLRPREVAAFLGTSLAPVYEMIHDGHIPCFHVRRIYRMPREEFLKWYEANWKNRLDGDSAR